MADIVRIEGFLADAGFDTPEAQERARAILEEAGLTRTGKTGMAADKSARALELLDEALLPVCTDPDCRRLAQERVRGRTSPPEMVTTTPSGCIICCGSNNRRAVELMAKALARHNLRRLLIVGGTPTLHAELAALLGDAPVELRCIDAAKGSHNKNSAKQNIAWADFAVVWGATPLPHKVSNLYTGQTGGKTKVISLARRGIAALCDEVSRSLA